MKVRNGFVSNSSSSSFVVQMLSTEKISLFEETFFKELGGDTPWQIQSIEDDIDYYKEQGQDTFELCKKLKLYKSDAIKVIRVDYSSEDLYDFVHKLKKIGYLKILEHE